MKLYVFSLFKDPSILDEIRRCYTFIEIDYSATGRYTKQELESLTLVTIYKTNLKLFYEESEEHLLEGIIAKFNDYHIVLVNRGAPYTESFNTSIKIPIVDSNGSNVLEDVICPTCHNITKQQTYNMKMIPGTRSISDRRLIFELRG